MHSPRLPGWTTTVAWSCRLLLLLLLSCSRSPSKDNETRPGGRVALPSAQPAVTVSSLVRHAAPAPSASGAVARNIEVRQTLPVVSAEELLESIRSSQAKATLVNAWASWCGPCREEMPMLAQLALNLAPVGVHVLLVSVDEPEDQHKAQAFLADHAIDLPSVLAARPLGAFKRGLNPRWPGMLPATFLFDDRGKLRYFWGGQAYQHEILPIVDGFLAGKPVDGEANFGLAPGQTSP